jgi:hypothetical protein
MMSLKMNVLAVVLLACDTQARDLSFERIAGYEPSTSVTDHVRENECTI